VSPAAPDRGRKTPRNYRFVKDLLDSRGAAPGLHGREAFSTLRRLFWPASPIRTHSLPENNRKYPDVPGFTTADGSFGDCRFQRVECALLVNTDSLENNGMRRS
jgi:hypothetical protein